MKPQMHIASNNLSKLYQNLQGYSIETKKRHRTLCLLNIETLSRNGNQLFLIQIVSLHLHFSNRRVFIGCIIVNSLIAIYTAGIDGIIQRVLFSEYTSPDHGNRIQYSKKLLHIVFLYHKTFGKIFQHLKKIPSTPPG